MFARCGILCRNFFARTFVGGMGFNVKRPYRVDIRMEHDKKRRIRRRNVGTRRMLKSEYVVATLYTRAAMHSSSLYGKATSRGDRNVASPHAAGTTPTTYDREMEEQVHQENEAMLNALGASVKNMKAMAGRLNHEAEEQNSLLQSVNTAFVSARRGVGTAIHGVEEMARTYGWRYVVVVALVIFALFYIIMRVVLSAARRKTTAT